MLSGLHKGIAWAAGVYNVAYGKMADGKGLDLLGLIILHNARVVGEGGESAAGLGKTFLSLWERVIY
jgi:hypothetical protein